MNFTWLQTKQSYSFIIEIPNMQSKNMSTALVEQLKQDLEKAEATAEEERTLKVMTTLGAIVGETRLPAPDGRWDAVGDKTAQAMAACMVAPTAE